MSAAGRVRDVQSWLDTHRAIGWTCLRVYVGFALVMKGFSYLTHQQDLFDLMTASSVPFASLGLAEFVAILHVAGGVLLAFGFKTRFAALVQVPNVLGAIVFVHWRAGLFSPNQTLELALLVLFVLLLFAVVGPGPWSVDWAFRDVAEHAEEPANDTLGPAEPSPSLRQTLASSPSRSSLPHRDPY